MSGGTRHGAGMTSTSGLDRLSLKSPAALVAAIPYLLGFPPAASVVFVWLEERRLLLTQRLDLPTADGRDDDGWLQAVWGHAAADHADELVAVAYDDGLRPELLAGLMHTAAATGISVRDVLVVRDGRWRSLLCTDEQCCPAEGRPVPEGDRDEVAAEFAMLGRAPVASRAELVRGFAPDPADPALVVAVEAGAQIAPDTLEQWRDQSIVDILDLLGDARPRPLTSHVVATVVVGLVDIRVRDTVLWEASRWSADDLCAAVATLQPVVRAAPVGWVAPVATCCAALAWLAGDGARALAALDRVAADDPEYSLARLLQASVTAGLPPSVWRDAMGSLTRGQCRHGT